MEDFTLPRVGQASKNRGAMDTSYQEAQPLLYARAFKNKNKNEPIFFIKKRPGYDMVICGGAYKAMPGRGLDPWARGPVGEAPPFGVSPKGGLPLGAGPAHPCHMPSIGPVLIFAPLVAGPPYFLNSTLSPLYLIWSAMA
jgi:hypothetical protein